MRAPKLLPTLALAALLLAAGVHAAPEEWRFAPDRPIDVERIDLELAVDLEAKRIEGSATLRFKAQSDLERVELDAVDHEIAKVELVSAEGRKDLHYDYDGKRLSIALQTPRGAEREVVVSYSVTDPEDGLNYFGPSEANPDVPYQVWSQGEPVSNRHWFPCLDHPDERQATSLTAHVDAGLTVVSNGKLTGKTKRKDGKVSWSFVQERPHVAYLVTLVVGTFAETEGKAWTAPDGREVSQTWYVPPDREADAPRAFKNTHAMLDLFSRKTGVPYPWVKYDQVVVEQFSAGGMENTGATTLNERTLHDERAHLDYSSDGLVAHELAHQWYGDLLTCRDWAHLWLNESFATYFDALWIEHSQGEADYLYDLFRNSERGMPAGARRPILDRRYPSPGSMFDGRAYPKGSCVIHMLRRHLGEDAFWRGIQRYTRDNQDRSVETDDLRRALERESGRNLERFFTQWLERPGHPKLKVALAHDGRRGLLTVTIEQTQEGEAYHFPAELLLRFGEREVTHVIPVQTKKERFTLATREAPSAFRFDPREAVLLKELEVRKGRALWIRQLGSGDTIGKIRAARHLAKDRRPAALEALFAALKSDPFWGVRAEIAKALGGVAGDEARAALLKSLREEHPKVRRAAAEALERRGRDATSAAALKALLTQGDPSYYVEAAALRAYGKAEAQPRPLLEAGLAKDSHNQVIRQAALDALRALDRPELVEVVRPYVSPRQPSRVRSSAARGLAMAGLPGATPAQVRVALEALQPLLADSNRWVRRAALEALQGIGGAARPLLAEVERLAQLDPRERVREAAEKAARAIREGAPPSQQLRELRQRAVELEKAKRSLEERVEKLERALDALRKDAGEAKDKEAKAAEKTKKAG